MRRLGLLFTVLLVAASCATAQQKGQALVARAIDAMGGVNALTDVNTLAVKGTVRQWDPEQSLAPGGETRFGNESTFTSAADMGAGAMRIDWVRSYAYPAPRSFTYTEIVTREAGYVAGIDTSGRNKQSLDSNPPAHTMSSLRLAAFQREARRTSPLLLLEMQRNPDRVAQVGDVAVGSASYPAVEYRTADTLYTVMFDRASGLPARIRTLDYDSIWGDVAYDLVLSDWQVLDGVRVATTQRYELSRRLVMETKIADLKKNIPIGAGQLAIPDAFRGGAARPATADVPYQWVLRRQFTGVYLDSENASYDTRVSQGLRLSEIAPGVSHAAGGTHNSLVVEMKDSVVVFDAPVSDRQSNMVLSAVRAKYLRKPIKYLVLTHHHMDHAGGVRAYAAEGATIGVGKGAGAHFRRVLAAPYTRNPDLTAKDLSGTPVVEVADKWALNDGTHEVQAYLLAPNSHTESMLFGYVPSARVGFVTDLWNPGPPLPAQLSPLQLAVVTGVKKAGISPERFAGGHGGVGAYAPLAERAGQ